MHLFSLFADGILKLEYIKYFRRLAELAWPYIYKTLSPGDTCLANNPPMLVRVA